MRSISTGTLKQARFRNALTRHFECWQEIHPSFSIFPHTSAVKSVLLTKAVCEFESCKVQNGSCEGSRVQQNKFLAFRKDDFVWLILHKFESISVFATLEQSVEALGKRFPFLFFFRTLAVHFKGAHRSSRERRVFWKWASFCWEGWAPAEPFNETTVTWSRREFGWRVCEGVCVWYFMCYNITTVCWSVLLPTTVPLWEEAPALTDKGESVSRDFCAIISSATLAKTKQKISVLKRFCRHLKLKSTCQKNNFLSWNSKILAKISPKSQFLLLSSLLSSPTKK